jgi:mannose-6-phosphate isomerase
MTIQAFNQYVLSSVVQGSGVLRKEQNVFPINKGDHFILPYDYGDITVEGKVEIITASPPEPTELRRVEKGKEHILV